MSDAANPEPGWYWGTNPSGRGCPIECQTYPGHKPLFLVGNQVFIEALPNGWTLGPRVEDLLRDAARWNHIDNIDGRVMTTGGRRVYVLGELMNREKLASVLDNEISGKYDEIAREPKPEGE